MAGKKFSLHKISVRRRTWVALTLITLLPIIVFVYYHFGLYAISRSALFVLVALVCLGWWVVLQMVISLTRLCGRCLQSLQDMNTHDSVADLGTKNEIDRLDSIFDLLSSKVKESVDELRTLSDRTETLNKAISRKVNVISSLLQANILFSKAAPSEQILQFLTERLERAVAAKVVVSLLKKEGGGECAVFLCGIDEGKVAPLLEKERVRKFFEMQEQCVLDSEHQTGDFLFIKDLLGLKNFIVHPVYLRREIIGVVAVGNPLDNFTFSSDDYETVGLFSHNMSIVWEHERLYKKVEALEMIDPLMGIYNQRFFFARLEEEIKRATMYQRPCGLLIMEIKNFSEYRETLHALEVEKILKHLVSICKDTMRPIDILGRIEDNRIGIILIERNKRQSHYVGIKLQEAIEAFLRGAATVTPQTTFALAENPIDGSDASQLLGCVEAQLKEQ